MSTVSHSPTSLHVLPVAAAPIVRVLLEGIWAVPPPVYPGGHPTRHPELPAEWLEIVQGPPISSPESQPVTWFQFFERRSETELALVHVLALAAFRTYDQVRPVPCIESHATLANIAIESREAISRNLIRTAGLESTVWIGQKWVERWSLAQLQLSVDAR